MRSAEPVLNTHLTSRLSSLEHPKSPEHCHAHLTITQHGSWGVMHGQRLSTESQGQGRLREKEGRAWDADTGRCPPGSQGAQGRETTPHQGPQGRGSWEKSPDEHIRQVPMEPPLHPASLSLSLSLPHLLIYGPIHTEVVQKSGRQLPPPQPATVHQRNETFYKEISLHAN